jgi:ribosome-associated protein
MFVPKWRLTISSSRSGGPGGQHVNRTESKVELRFRVDEADWIPPRVLERFKRLFANRITQDGDFVLTNEEHRSRQQNLDTALRKLSDMLDQAAVEPKIRRATKPTKGSQRRRLDSKKMTSQRKKDRRRVDD